MAEATKDKGIPRNKKALAQSCDKTTKVNRFEKAISRQTAHVSSEKGPQLHFLVGDLLVQFDAETDEAAKQRFLMQPVLPAQIERFKEPRQQMQPIRTQGQFAAVNTGKIRGGGNGEAMATAAMVGNITGF